MVQKIMMPVGALVICLFMLIGWRRSSALQEAVGTNKTPGALMTGWYWTCTILTPILILIVLLGGFGLLDKLFKAAP
jgi:SNF family Na+-dependent transporter